MVQVRSCNLQCDSIFNTVQVFDLGFPLHVKIIESASVFVLFFVVRHSTYWQSSQQSSQLQVRDRVPTRYEV